MKVTPILGSFVLLAIAVEPARASDAYSRTEAERYIKDGEAAWAESVTTNDSSVVTRILADDCVLWTNLAPSWLLNTDQGIFYQIISTTPTCDFSATPRSFKAAKPGPARADRKDTLSGPTPGFDAMGNGASWQPKTFPCR